MKYFSTINGKWGMLLSITGVLVVICVKFYFIPQVDRFLEMSIEFDMKQNMIAFEKIIHIVANIADGDEVVVRKALLQIGEDPDIPVTLRRSNSITLQYGSVPTRNPSNSWEEQVLQTGIPLLNKTEKEFEYIYPLRVIEVCQECHLAENGKDEIPLGYVLGLAVSTVPLSKLHDNKLFFFVKDLFVTNTLMIMLILVGTYFGLQFIVIHPLRRVREQLNYMAEANDDEMEMVSIHDNEIEDIEACLDELFIHHKVGPGASENAGNEH
ncbi:MAG: hypothetical protein HQM12_16990 [SAR324 cluster bacterium]|nr:hypothetical protein [SAR324 cluster bacterium]